MKKKNTKFKILFLISMMVASTFLVNDLFRTSIHAEDDPQLIMVASKLYYNNSGSIEELPSDGVPYEADLVLEISVTGIIDHEMIVDYKDKFGTKLYPYYEGVLQFDGVNATQAEYEAFTTSGMHDQVTRNTKKYTLHLKSTGENPNEINCGINFYFKHGNGGSIKYLYTLKHKGSFHGQTHNVSFYDYDGTLLKVEKVRHKESAKIPEVERKGYTFLGFNSDKDGKGEYYDHQEIIEDRSFYAIYEKNIYKVNYYVDNKLYTTREVAYGDNAENIILKGDSKRKFVGWNKSLKNITGNYEVHAVFETIKEEIKDQPTKKPEEIKVHPAPAKANPVETPIKENQKNKAKINKTNSIEGLDTLALGKKVELLNNQDAKSVDNENKVAASLTSVDVPSKKDNTWQKIVPFAISGISILILIALMAKNKKSKR